MNSFIIIISVAIIAAIITYASFKNSEEIKEEILKFEPRKVTYVPIKDRIALEKPKKKYYKKRNKKNKPAVAETALVEKKPVGRPRKIVE